MSTDQENIEKAPHRVGWHAWVRIGYTPVDPLFEITFKDNIMHDRNGTELKVGDIVNLPCRITSLAPTDAYCNVEITTLYPSRSDGAKTSFSAMNTAQIVLVDRPVQPDPAVNPEPPAEPTERVPE